MKTDVYNQSGEKTGEMTLDERVFGLPWNANLAHQVIVSMQSNKRAGTAHAKDRGEVSGGGKKPWRQKGTGKARHGSIRSPIWIGGGVTHGPLKEKNYEKKINKKMKKKALFTVLSQKMRDKEILILDGISFSERKTKLAAETINNLRKIKEFANLAKKNGKAVIYLPRVDEKAVFSFRNIPFIKTEETRNINPLEAISSKFVVLTKEGLDFIKV